MSEQITKSYFELKAGLIHYKGEKAAQLLHGQLTNDIKKLAVGQGNFNLLLSLKGKVRALCMVIRIEEGCLLLCDSDDVSLFTEHFSKMAPLSRVEIIDLSQHYFFAHLIGDPFLFKKNPGAYSIENNLNVFQNNRLGVEGTDVWGPIADKSAFLSLLSNKQIPLLLENDIENLRIRNGVPKNHVDFNDENLPQECLLDRALHFEKGCYLGQEIIARLHYKGHVNKLLKRLHITGSQEVSVGAKLIFEGKEVGLITSITQGADDVRALGYVPYKRNADLFDVESGGQASIIP